MTASASNPTIKAIIDPTDAVNGAARVVAALNQIKNAANNNNLSSVDQALQAIAAHAQTMASAMNANTSAMKASTAAAQQLASQMNAASSSMSNAGNSAHTSSSAHAGLAGELKGLAVEALGAYIGLEGLKKAMEMSDEMSGMNAKLRLAVSGWADYALAQQQVLAISNQTRSDLVSTGELYGTIARGADGLGISQNQVARATQTITDAFKVSGVSARMASTAVLELSEAFGAGTLQGNHLKILMSDAPRLAKVLADSLDVPTNKLREMGAQGKLTSQMLISAFTNTDIGSKLDAELATVPKTWGDIVTEVKNDAYQLSYAVTSGGDLASKVYDALSGSISSILPVMTSLGEGLGEIFSTLGSAFSNAYDFLMSIGGGSDTTLTAVQGVQVAIKVAADFISALINDAEYGFELVVTAISAVRDALNFVSQALGGASQTSTMTAKDMALGWIGLANEVKVFTMGMSNAFSTAFESIGEMFTDVENRAKAFFSGNLNAFSGIGDSLAKEYGKGKSAIDGLFDAAKNAGSKEVASAIFDQVTGANAKPTPVGDGTGSTRKIAEAPKEDKKAEKAAEELAKKMKAFWDGLENGVNSEQAFGQQLEINNKIFDYRKIVGDKLSQQDKDRIASLIREKDFNTAIAKLKEDTANLKIDNDQSAKTDVFTKSQQQQVNTIAAAAAAGKTGMDALVARAQAAEVAQRSADAALRVYNDVQAKVAADAKKGVDTTDDQYQATLKLYQVEAQRKDNLAHINDLLGKGQAVIDKYDALTQRANQKSGYLDEINSVKADLNNPASAIDKDAAARTIQAISNQIYLLDHAMQTQWGDAISALGDQIKGVWGKAISGIGGLISALVKGVSGDLSGFGGIGQVLGALSKDSNGNSTAFGSGLQDAMKSSLTDVFSSKTWTAPFKSITDSFGKTKDDFNTIFGSNSTMAKSLGAVGNLAGKGLVGAQEGDIANSLLKGLGVTTSKTGAELGGGIGSIAFGPIGGAIGGLLGGIVGGLFKSAPKGGTTISGGSLGAFDTNTYGNNSAAESASSDAASSVISGIQSIASQLGATFAGLSGTGISIGTYKGKWRVNTQGTTLGGSSSPVAGLTDYGKDGEAEAVEAAIKAAVNKGVLNGLDALTQKILQTNTDLDTAIQIAKEWQNVVVDQKFATSGIQDALIAQDALNKSLDTLQQQLEAAGASASDMATFYAYAQEQAAKGLKAILDPLNSLKDTLNGTGSGVTEYNQLLAKQADFAKMQATLAAGGTVNEDDFSNDVQSILQLAGDVYGTSSSDFQAIRAQLLAANDKEIANATKSYNDNLSSVAKSTDATSSAITTQTSVLSTQNAQLLNLSQAQLAALNTLIAQGGASGGGSVAVNGKLVKSV